MPYLFGANYWEYYKKKKKKAAFREDMACFSEVAWATLKAMKYVVHIDNGELTDAAIVYYFKFLKRLFPKLKWDFGPIVKVNDKVDGKQRQVTVHLKQIHKNEYQNLLYVTAFRYPDEYSQVVKRLWDWRKKAKTLKKQFQVFQEIHHNGITRNSKLPHSDLKFNQWRFAGHGLIYAVDGYGVSAKTPISLAKFRANLDKGKNSVNAYFS